MMPVVVDLHDLVEVLLEHNWTQTQLSYHLLRTHPLHLLHLRTYVYYQSTQIVRIHTTKLILYQQ